MMPTSSARETPDCAEDGPDAVLSSDGESTAVARRRLLYWPLVRSAACAERLDPRLLDAVITVESNYQPLAVSSAGAAGLAQLMPGTAKELEVFNRFDPRQSVFGGARYLRRMIDAFDSVVLGVAAYNAGPSAVRRSRGVPANSETPRYVRRVLARAATSAEPSVPGAVQVRSIQLLRF